MTIPGSCDARAPQPERRIRSREALRCVRDAFAECGDGDLQAAYADARWRTRGLRLGLALVDRVLPITLLIEFSGEVNQRVREQGLAEACAASTHRLGLDCEYVMSEATRKVLETSPVFVYGNHPTVLTPFLVVAAARRNDVRLFMVDYVRRLVPSVGEYLLPLELSAERDRVEWHRGGIVRVVSRRLARVVMKGQDRAEAKRVNQQALADGVRYLEQGGCVAIFPGGGGRDERRWYPGIGQVARDLRLNSEAPDIFLLPVHEEVQSESHVYRGLRRLSGRAPVVSGNLVPVRVRFAEPRRLRELVPSDADRDEITRRLQADYEAAFPRARTGFFSRLLFPRRAARERSQT